MFWVGVDVGGTFTDIVVYDDESGAVLAGKSPSTPANPADGVLNALEQLSVDLAFVSSFCLLYTSPSPRDATLSRMPSSA